MRAAVCPAYGESLRLEERPAPDPGPGQVRVEVDAAGLNFADVEQCRGDYPDGPTPPFVPGMEVAGRVDAVGAAVDREVGDFVAGVCDAGLAEFAVVDADAVVAVPDHLPATAAAGVPVQWLTAHNCLFEWGGLSAGDRVLVHAAAGGVGSAAVQVAAASELDPAPTVVATASTREKLDFARDLGADHGIDYEAASVADAVADSVGAVDLVLDGVGGRAFSESVAALADHGRVVTFGAAGGRPGTVATPRLFHTNASVVGYHLRHALETVPERVRTAVDPVYRLLDEGTAAVQLDSTWPLAEAEAALDRLRDRAHRGKVVVEV